MVPSAPRSTTTSVVAVGLSAVTRIRSEPIVTVKKVTPVTQAPPVGNATVSAMSSASTAAVSEDVDAVALNVLLPWASR